MSNKNGRYNICIRVNKLELGFLKVGKKESLIFNRSLMKFIMFLSSIMNDLSKVTVVFFYDY